MKRLLLAWFVALMSVGLFSTRVSAQSESPSISLPDLIIQRVSKPIRISDPSRAHLLSDTVTVLLNGARNQVILRQGEGELPYNFPRAETVTVVYESNTYSLPVSPVPLWTSILPPLIAILMAFLIKEVYTSLFSGVLVGAAILAYYQGASALLAVFVGIFRIADTYLIETLTDTGHAQVIVFLLLIGSTVALVSLNGGMRGLIRWLSRHAKSPRSGQLITFLMDLCIFFDDYANTLVVGSTMRPMAKSLRISKEKLSFIVDSTAAPVGAIALITTWIGAELSYIQEGLNVVGIEESAYSLFVASIPSRFYPIFMLVFVLLVAFTGRDYGPMYGAERRAYLALEDGEGDKGDKLDSEIEPPEALRGRWFNAVIPILVLVFTTMAGIFITGYDASVWASDKSFGAKLMANVGGADSYIALLWASITSTFVAIIMTAVQRILSFRKTMDAMMTGFKLMLPAVIVLVLAWTLALMTKHMHTAEFVSSALIEWNVTPLLLPALTFVLAGIIAFSTGTSWGTMAILYPLVIPVTWQLSNSAGMEYGAAMDILLNVISCILAGAVMGDHCSPISDTTIMSSSSTGCDHLAHVRTQMPYALTVGAVALLVGTIPSTLGVPNWLLLLLGAGAMWAVLRLFGRCSRKSVEACDGHCAGHEAD